MYCKHVECSFACNSVKAERAVKAHYANLKLKQILGFAISRQTYFHLAPSLRQLELTTINKYNYWIWCYFISVAPYFSMCTCVSEKVLAVLKPFFFPAGEVSAWHYRLYIIKFYIPLIRNVWDDIYFTLEAEKERNYEAYFVQSFRRPAILTGCFVLFLCLAFIWFVRSHPLEFL